MSEHADDCRCDMCLWRKETRELRDRNAELSQGILACQTRMLALERELAEAKERSRQLLATNALCVEDGERWEQRALAAEQDRDETHAAIRLLGQAMAMYDNGGFVGDNIDRWFNQFIFHAPVIRRAMGEGK